MADGYAPALFLEVLAFWLVLRWLLVARLILFFGRLLVLMMTVGALSALDDHEWTWAACFAGSALLAWLLLRRWRGRAYRGFAVRAPIAHAWKALAADEVAALCERRIGIHVDAAAPATVDADPPRRCVLALAGDGVWVLEDESRVGRPEIGRVLACWDRKGLVAHVEHSRRGERFELSWPRHGALVRGLARPGPAADLLAGHLVADEITLRS